MKVLVLGASGFVGRHLVERLRGRGDVVVAMSLRDPAAAALAASTCDAVVNLSGEPVLQRWTAKAKRAILDSRTDLPRRFFAELRNAGAKLGAYVAASAVGYYGTSETAAFDELSPPGDDFLAHVCVALEAQANEAHDFGARVAVVRTGIALGTDGGALSQMLPAFRMGAGGTLGNGRQWMPWIHVDDLVGIYVAALDRGEGAYAGTAPIPVTNAAFTRALARALHRPTFLPVPPLALRLLYGDAAEILTKGQRVFPKRTTGELAYPFAFPDLDGALANLFPRS